MGRVLGPADYGVLITLMAVINIYSIPVEAIQNIISRYTSKFNLKKENGKIKFLMFKSLRSGLKIAMPIFLISMIIAFPLSNFLNINILLIFIANLFIFHSFLGPINKGILQGRKKFGLLGGSLIIEAGLKLFFAVSFVIFGYKIFGAMIGILFGVLAGFIFSFYFNRSILEKKEEKASFNNAYPNGIPYFIVMVVVLLALNLDIILAKRFFSPEMAGKYGVISMLGKMIFFGTIAISKSMFPLTSEKQDDNKNPFELFKKATFIILGISVVAIGIFALIPELIIRILYGPQYIDMASFLIYPAIALSFLSLSNLNLMYGLSTKGIKNQYYLFVFLIIGILLLSLFHNTILEYMLAFMVSNIIMFIGSFFFLKK
jgi:O-antigen/teichoic acid export membrane protein